MTLFENYFNEWYAFPAGPVEDDIYSYWYEKSSNNYYYPDNYEVKKDKYILADSIRAQVAYEGVSKSKYNLKMLYFCCLLEKFYIEFPFFDKKNILSKNNHDKIIYLVNEVKQLLSEYFKDKYGNANYVFTVDDLVWLSHNLNLWYNYYSPTVYKRMPIEKMNIDAMAFYIRVTGKDAA